MNMPRRAYLIILLVLASAILAGWYFLTTLEQAGDDSLKASGTVEAVELIVAPEMAGRIAEVFVATGDEIESDQALFRLEDDLLTAQFQRASAARQAAQAARRTAQEGVRMAEAGLTLALARLDSAQVGLESARLQHQQVLNAARLAQLPDRTSAWRQDIPSAFELPVWYFDRPEEIVAAEAEVDAARQALEVERANFQAVIRNSSNADLAQAEQRLAQAQAAYLVAQDVLARSRAARERADLEAYAQDVFDAAEAELEAAQSDYDRLLSEEAAGDLLEARARLMVARERHETAQDRLAELLSGEDSLEVNLAEVSIQLAETNLAQAQAGVDQAEANLSQARTNLTQSDALIAQTQAELESLRIQMDMLVIRAAVPGVIISRDIEPGEVIQPAAIAMVLGQLESLTITVYLPEDRYGQISLGDQARVTVDSYPDVVFPATVKRIADRAEYTPRNVQTEEGRRTTVFAIELSVDNASGRLKPGMPADVAFEG